MKDMVALWKEIQEMEIVENDKCNFFKEIVHIQWVH